MWNHLSDFWRQSSRHFECFFLPEHHQISHNISKPHSKPFQFESSFHSLCAEIHIVNYRNTHEKERYVRLSTEPNETYKKQGSKAITWKKCIPNRIAPCQIPTYQLRMSWKEVFYTQVLAQPTTRTTPRSAEAFLWFHTNSVCACVYAMHTNVL